MARKFLLVLLFGVFLFILYRTPSVGQHDLTDPGDASDSRPAVNVLFIGNSRTFFNDMPFMVRKIADSAQSPQLYRITMHALGGVGFADHWGNSGVQQLLGQKWDYVVLQGRSNEQQTDDSDNEFQYYGQKLIERIKAGARCRCCS